MLGQGGLMTSRRAQILKERLITAITADGAIKNSACVAISARTSLIHRTRQQSSRIKGVTPPHPRSSDHLGSKGQYYN